MPPPRNRPRHAPATRTLRVLVACEFSGVVRDAFLARGHDAYSCDLLPALHRPPKEPWRHVKGDVRPLLQEPWDLVIAHPPYTYLCKVSSRWQQRPGRREAMLRALHFFQECLGANAPRVCVENPRMYGPARTTLGLPTQWVQPFWFGDPISKATGLWLRGLPLLTPTRVVDAPGSLYDWIQRTANYAHRGHLRSITPPGLAAAMAAQWG